MRSDRSLYLAIFVTLAAVLLLAPHLVYPFFLMKVLCFAIFATAFNLLLGYGGLLSFGHAAFFGSAAYVAAHAAKVWGLPPELAVLLAVLVSAALGLFAGIVAIRRQGIYFAMITLALAQLVYFLALQLPFTGAEDGIQGVPRGTLFGLIDLQDDTALYYVVAVLYFAALLFVYRLTHSPFGRVLRSIRGNEARAVSLGYDADRYKLIVFTLSAALSGLAGGSKAIIFQIATLVDVHLAVSAEVVLMAIIGGVGTIFGPSLGALIVVAMQNYLAGLGEWVIFIQGAAFVVCVLLFRSGILGVVSRWIGRPL